MSAAKKTKKSKKKFGWGGARPGAGRPRNKEFSVPHHKRPRIDTKKHLHIVIRTLPSVPDLTKKPLDVLIPAAVASTGAEQSVRFYEPKLLSHEVHMLATAPTQPALSRALQGLSIRIARRVNGFTAHSGKVLAERFELSVHATARAAASALAAAVQRAKAKHSAVARTRSKRKG
jgi:hypothetical protein